MATLAQGARGLRRSMKVAALGTQTCVRLSADVREAALKRRTDFVREAFAFMGRFLTAGRAV